MDKTLLSTFMHVLELVVSAALAIGVAWAAKTLFDIDLKEPLVVVLGFVLMGAAKFARASSDIPVPDFVNAPLKKGK